MLSLRPIRQFSGFVLVGCLTIWTLPASAWSRTAHAMVGDIATGLLSPAATLAVAELLKDDLAADGQPSGRATLGQVASWPDELREIPAYKSTYPYHFDDIPICPEGGKPPDRALYCPNGACATAWFKQQVAILADKSAPTRARNEALKWIVHLVGDLHQPLHASDNHDRGGNDIKISFFGALNDPPVEGRPTYPYNLHTAWDRLIPYRMFDERGGTAAFLADMPDEKTQKAWQSGDIDSWTLESHAIAVGFVYPSLPIHFTCGVPITGIVPLDATYYRPAADIAAIQIRKAGVRLAKVLNDTLADR